MSDLKPFFCFYGGKWRVGRKYPAPICDTIVEPFAGAAGYAVRNASLKVHLFDTDPVICGIWDYLINATETEIRALPVKVDHVDNIQVPQEAKHLIGFWMNKGSVGPCKQPSAWMRSGIPSIHSYWGETIRERIASQVSAIRHWTVENKDFTEAPNIHATWFIDPPYATQSGRHYRFKMDDYTQLAQWCKDRQGQTIVCENEGATWLPFSTFGRIKATEGRKRKAVSNEVIWTQTN